MDYSYIPRNLLFELKRAESVCIFTGAELSAEAGLTTFKSPGYEWKDYNTSELSSKQGFEKNPQIVWSWYQQRRKSAADYGPSNAHNHIAQMQKMFNNVSIITQNVDCLHQYSGIENVLELNGNIFQSKCNDCNKPFTDYDIKKVSIPRCPHCGGYIRPKVNWFGERIEKNIIDKASTIVAKADVLIVVGIYSEMYPSDVLIKEASLNNTFLIEIQPDDTIFTDKMNSIFRGRYDTILRDIIKAYLHTFVNN